MKSLNPLSTKYHSLYWEMAHSAARQSVATRHQVGALVVTPTGMISVGWNGTPSGLSNKCEEVMFVEEEGITRPKTLPHVVHAERNAIDKMTRQGTPTMGSLLFLTRAPCLECAKSLHGLGLAGIHFDEPHDDMSGVRLLMQTGTPVIWRTGREPLLSSHAD